MSVIAVTSEVVLLLCAVRDGRVWRHGRTDYSIGRDEKRDVVTDPMRALHAAGLADPPRPLDRSVLWTLTREGFRIIRGGVP